MTAIKILCIGEPLKESVATKHPDGTLTDQVETGFAGDMAPNFAAYARMAATQLNVHCDIDVLTALGPAGDAPSDAAANDLSDRNLALHPQTKRIAGKTLGSVINLKNPDGSTHHEKVQMDRASSAFRDMLTGVSDDDLRQMVKGYSHIIVSGIPLACVRERAKLVRLLELAKEQYPPSKIIVSTNLRPANWKMADAEHPAGTQKDPEWKSKAKKWLDRIIFMADMIFANAADEKNVRQSTSPLHAAASLRSLNSEADIVITNDENPITLRYRDSASHQDVIANIPIAQPSSIIDTTGAGDSLAATALISKLSGANLRQSVERGTLVASQVVGFKGALPKPGTLLSLARQIQDQPQLQVG